MQNEREFRVKRSISGSGNGFVNDTVLDVPIGGHLEGYAFRQNVGGTAASYIIHFATNEAPLTSTPDDLDDVSTTSSITSTPSATTADINTDFGNPRAFHRGLRLGLDVVASGAFTLEFSAWGRVAG